MFSRCLSRLCPMLSGVLFSSIWTLLAGASYYNVAVNPQDLPQADWNALSIKQYPHASSNSETRGETAFYARNAINGNTSNVGHGDAYPSWGPEQRTDNWLRIDFGREVAVDSVTLYIRADFPHDNYWETGTFTFSDGSKEVVSIDSTAQPQGYRFAKRVTSWIRLDSLIWNIPNTWCALTEMQVWGHDTIAGPICRSFSDNFEDGLADGWTALGGLWSIIDGTLYVPGHAGAKAMINDSVFSEFQLDVDIQLHGSSGNAGIVFAVTNPAEGADSYRGYYVGLNAGTNPGLVVGKANNNWQSITTLEKPIVADAPNHLRVRRVADTIAIYLNDLVAPVILNDATYPGGAIGLRTFNMTASFDNLVISEPYAVATRPAAATTPIHPAASLQVSTQRDMLQVSYALSEEGMVRLDLFDLTGSHLQTLFSGMQQAGLQRITADRLPVTSPCVLRLRHNGSTVQTRLITQPR